MRQQQVSEIGDTDFFSASRPGREKCARNTNEGRPKEGRPYEGRPKEGRPKEGRPKEGRPYEGKANR
jgi:hypothetical protein